MDDTQVRREFEALIKAAFRVSQDVGREVEEILHAGRGHPLDRDELERLLTTLIATLRRNQEAMADPVVRAALEGDIGEFVARVAEARDRVTGRRAADEPPRLRLVEHNGSAPTPVSPRPRFYGREVAMLGGWVRTTDLHLWDGNERLEIHLGQFRERQGRDPEPEELLDIMLSRMHLAGVPDDQRDDQFEIVELARSIAANGVQRPPILDLDGTLLDGNRRAAACYYILMSGGDEFSFQAKRQAEWIYVWQLTEYATQEDRDSVVVALNFEPDYKQQWPEYIKAKKVYDQWQAMLALQPRPPGSAEQAQMKRELSERFALGPNTQAVNRYIKMVEWALDFEDHHVVTRRHDPFEVQHRASRYFQYFDELAKGERSGVAFTLRQDDVLRELVFDLLFEGKFRNWRQIRDLKYVAEDEDALDEMRKARETSDLTDAQEHLDDAVSIARTRRAEARSVGANSRIEVFVDWLEQVPPKAFRDQIRPENLLRLLRALRLVSGMAEAVLGEDGR